MSTRLFPLPGAKIRDGVRIGFPPAGTVGLFLVENMDAATPGELVLFAGYPDGTQVAVGGQVVFPPDQHTHIIADVTDLQAALDAKAAVVHTHEIEDVNGLQDALNNAGGEAALTGTLADRIFFARRAEVFSRVASAELSYVSSTGRASFSVTLRGALSEVGSGDTNRYFSCTSPTSGNITCVNGSDVSATAAGILILPGFKIYYIPPWGSGSVASVAANFRIVRTGTGSTGPFEVPPEWVLIFEADTATRGTFIGGIFLRSDGIGHSSWDGARYEKEVMSGEAVSFTTITATTGFKGPLAGVSENFNTLTYLSGGDTLSGPELGSANVHVASVTKATTISKPGSGIVAGKANSFTMVLTFDGAWALTWPGEFTWLGGPPEIVGAAGRTDVISGFTVDGGATWHCSYAIGGFTA